MTDFIRNEVSKIVFVTTIADTDAPTVAEITGGDDLSDDLINLTGLEYGTNMVPKPNLGSRFTPTTPGMKATPEPALEISDEQEGTSALRTALAEGTTGYLVMCPYGITATMRCEVWPVETGSVNDIYVVDGSKVASFEVKLAVTDPPIRDAEIAA